MTMTTALVIRFLGAVGVFVGGYLYGRQAAEKKEQKN